MLSVLLVTFDSAAEIGACLDAVLAQEVPHEVEVIAGDNASADDSLAVLEGYGARVTVIARGRNDGYAPAVNDLFARSRGELVLLLNPDVVLEPGCLTALAEHLDAHPEAGAAAAYLLEEDGSPQRFARREPTLREMFWTLTRFGAKLDGRRGGRALRRRTYAEEWEAGFAPSLPVDSPAAACVLARRAVLEPRPYDPALPLFYNDTDLWRRARRAGWRIDVVTAARAGHGGGTSVRRVDAVRMRAEWVVTTRRYARLNWRPPARTLVYAMFLLDAAVSALDRTQEGQVSFRGTLGGLGLPGGPEPWLTPRRRVGRPRGAR